MVGGDIRRNDQNTHENGMGVVRMRSRPVSASTRLLSAAMRESVRVRQLGQNSGKQKLSKGSREILRERVKGEY